MGITGGPWWARAVAGPAAVGLVVALAACQPTSTLGEPAAAASSGPAASATAAPVAGTATSAPPSASTTAAAPPASTRAPAPETASAAGQLVPVVGVTDGDTIRVRVGTTTERVRVIGIDTPELASRDCLAQQAASRMQSLVQSRTVRIVADPTQDDRDRYGRLLRHVLTADGTSVAAVLLGEGLGEEYTYDQPYAGQAGYRAAEAAARAAGRGVWGTACAAPPVAAVPVAPAPGGTGGQGSPSSCVIKGNINNEGEKIYHLPDQRYYGVTKISPEKGERMFCSEQDAVAAGWRRSKV